MNPAATVTGRVKKNAAQKISEFIPSFYNISMKYSLRSLMIVVILGPAVLASAYFLWPHTYTFGPIRWWGWDDTQKRSPIPFIAAVILALGALRAFAHRSRFQKP